MNPMESEFSLALTLLFALVFIGRVAPHLREALALLRAVGIFLFRWCFEAPVAVLRMSAGTPWLLRASAVWLLPIGVMLVLCTTFPLFVIVRDWLTPGPGAALPALHVKLGIAGCYLLGMRIIGVALRTLKSGQLDGGTA